MLTMRIGHNTARRMNIVRVDFRRVARLFESIVQALCGKTGSSVDDVVLERRRLRSKSLDSLQV